jgi:hypothetical protein
MKTNNSDLNDLIKTTTNRIQGIWGSAAAWVARYHYLPGDWFEPVPVRRVRRNRYRV